MGEAGEDPDVGTRIEDRIPGFELQAVTQITILVHDLAQHQLELRRVVGIEVDAPQVRTVMNPRHRDIDDTGINAKSGEKMRICGEWGLADTR